tara:strand:- start:812 stop:1126 length:315 start_codon:yes stop_codon:yes gene_type:complete
MLSILSKRYSLKITRLSSVITLATITTVSSSGKVFAQSNLLENVKKNPAEAIALCSKFKSLNSKGISASSNESIAEISNQKKLSKMDAEILSMYVRGLHCPEVT